MEALKKNWMEGESDDFFSQGNTVEKYAENENKIWTTIKRLDWIK